MQDFRHKLSLHLQICTIKIKMSYVDLRSRSQYFTAKFTEHLQACIKIFGQWCNFKISFIVFDSPTPTLMAFTGVTNAHGPSPQPVACRSPSCSLTTATGSFIICSPGDQSHTCYFPFATSVYLSAVEKWRRRRRWDTWTLRNSEVPIFAEPDPTWTNIYWQAVVKTFFPSFFITRKFAGNCVSTNDDDICTYPFIYYLQVIVVDLLNRSAVVNLFNCDQKWHNIKVFCNS